VLLNLFPGIELQPEIALHIRDIPERPLPLAAKK
jgi:hypothetical protein